MSERQPPRSGLSPSPLPLVVLIAVVTVVVLGAIYFLSTGLNAPSPVQTGAAGINPNAPSAQVAIQAASDVVPASTPPAERTELPLVLNPTPVTPGPTAQFDSIPPPEEWSTYVDPVDNFSIRYPTDWYLITPGPQQEGGGARTIQIYSFDPEDMTNRGKGETPPENYAVLEIITDDPALAARPYVQGEPFVDWVHRYFPYYDGFGPKLLEEHVISIGGREGVVQFSELNDVRKQLYLPLGERVMMAQYKYETPANITQQTLEIMMNSIEFR